MPQLTFNPESQSALAKSVSRSEETSNTRASTNKAVLQMVNLWLEEGNTHFSRTFDIINSK